MAGNKPGGGRTSPCALTAGMSIREGLRRGRAGACGGWGQLRNYNKGFRPTHASPPPLSPSPQTRHPRGLRDSMKLSLSAVAWAAVCSQVGLCHGKRGRRGEGRGGRHSRRPVAFPTACGADSEGVATYCRRDRSGLKYHSSAARRDGRLQGEGRARAWCADESFNSSSAEMILMNQAARDESSIFLCCCSLVLRTRIRHPQLSTQAPW